MMKKAFAAMALAATTMSAQAGVLINEGFDDVPALSASGWVFDNKSTPGGATSGWFQGVAEVFGAQAGAAGSYAAVNFNSAPPGGAIDSWLLTPEFDASKGIDITFYLRSAGWGMDEQLAYSFTGSGGIRTIVDLVGGGDWTLVTAHLDANVLGTTRLAFEYMGTSDTADYIGLDSLTVSAPDAGAAVVPEPATLFLCAGGLLGLGALRRRPRA